MRPFDWGLVPDAGLVLLTVAEVSDESLVCVADFRDTHALAYVPTNAFMGQSRTRGMRLGKLPLQMRDGIWFMEEDLEVPDEHSEVRLRSELVRLRPIP